jgi:hypothetical protein
MRPTAWTARLAALLSLDESPWRTALALAVGVFISFTPFWGVQTLLALVVATVCRLNRAVTVTGTWLNLPWFAPFVYAGAVKVGALLWPDLSGVAGIGTWLLLGSTALGVAAGVVTWLVAFGALRVGHRRRRARSGASRPAA